MEHRRNSDLAEEVVVPTGDVGTRGNGKPAEQHEEGAIIAGIRATDIEPYTGLRYLSKLFRFMAIILLLLFGGNRFSSMMGDVAKGLKSFKAGMADEDEDKKKKSKKTTKKTTKKK